MFAIWPLGCYGDILGQNHEILLKNRQILEKIYHYFIFITDLNPSESSDDKCHRLSFMMSQTRFVYFIGHFGAKKAEFLNENHEPNTYIYKINLLNH
jgi:hypothetical protein